MRQETNHHWFRYWLVAFSAPSHYLNQCWIIVNLTIGNKLQWNLNRNPYIFIQENEFQNVVWPQCVKLSSLAASEAIEFWSNFDSFRCSQWGKFRQHDDFSVSVLDFWDIERVLERYHDNTLLSPQYLFFRLSPYQGMIILDQFLPVSLIYVRLSNLVSMLFQNGCNYNWIWLSLIIHLYRIHLLIVMPTVNMA